jgi:hypothetical protein
MNASKECVPEARRAGVFIENGNQTNYKLRQERHSLPKGFAQKMSLLTELGEWWPRCKPLYKYVAPNGADAR